MVPVYMHRHISYMVDVSTLDIVQCKYLVLSYLLNGLYRHSNQGSCLVGLLSVAGHSQPGSIVRSVD
jgi:hypothetical protein